MSKPIFTIYQCRPESLAPVKAKEIKDGDVVKCTHPDGSIDFRFVSDTREDGFSFGVWRKTSARGDGGGCGLDEGCEKQGWKLERVLPHEVNRVRAFYNQVRLKFLCIRVKVQIPRPWLAEINLKFRGDDLWLKIQKDLSRDYLRSNALHHWFEFPPNAREYRGEFATHALVLFSTGNVREITALGPRAREEISQIIADMRCDFGETKLVSYADLPIDLGIEL